MQRSSAGRRPSAARRRWIPLFLSAAAIAGCSTDPAGRRDSIYALKSDPTPANVGAIRVWLDDEDRNVRATALNALVELEVPDAEKLALDALGDPDGFVRATGAKLVGDLGRAEHADALAGLLLEDPDPVVRQRAAEALARLGGQRAVDALAQALADPEARVRRAAIDGLESLDPASAVEELKGLLHADPVWEIRAQAAHVLGLTGSPDVLADLEQAREDPNEFVRSAAASALHVHEQARLGRKDGREGPGV
jgi:HEAT repeat protein